MNDKILTELFENSKIIANYIKNDFDIKLSSKDKEILFPFIYKKLKVIFKKIMNKDKTLINICNTILKKYNINHKKESKKSTDKMSGGLELLLDNDEIINYIKINKKKIVKEENNTSDKIKLYFENILEYLIKNKIFGNNIPKNSTIDKNIIIYFNYLLNKEKLNDEKYTENNKISKLYNKLFFNYLDTYFIDKNNIDINRIILNIDKLPKNIYILIKIINELILINKLIKTKKYNKIILFIIIIYIISNIHLKYQNLFDFFITIFLIYLMNLLIFI